MFLFENVIKTTHTPFSVFYNKIVVIVSMRLKWRDPIWEKDLFTGFIYLLKVP